MKAFKTLTFAAFAAVAAISCSKEVAPIVVDEKPIDTPVETISIEAPVAMTFTGITDNEPGTKTVLSGADINWNPAEKIYLFDGTAPRAFTSENDAVASTVTFSGSASSASSYYAVYPSGTISGKVISTTIPVIQAATANSFAPKANVAVAYTESVSTDGNVLQFKNVGAVVKFQLSNSDVRKVKLEAIGGEKMAGPVNVTYGEGANFTSAIVAAEAESCVVLDGGASNLSADTPYYLAIYPTTYTGGFKITLIKADGSFRSFSNKTSQTLARNDLMDLDKLPEVTSWKTGGAVDQLTYSLIGVTGTSYSHWDEVSNASSAVYKGQSAGGNSAIQLRATSPSGIVTTTSGGKATKISVSWNSNTASGRTLDIYGKNTAYSDASDLYGDSNGTNLGSIEYGTSTELNITGDYTYIGLRSNSGALYLDELNITWGDPSVTPPTLPTVGEPSTAITNVSSTSLPLAGGSVTFDVDSNVPWTVATSQPSYSSVSVSSNKVTVTFATLDSGERSATITVTPSEGTPVSESFTQSGIEVYTLYTSTLVEGDYIICDDTNALTNTVTSAPRLNVTTVSISANKITNPDASIVWHLSNSGDTWTLYNASVDKYVVATGTTGRANLSADDSVDAAKWTVTKGSDTYDFISVAYSSVTQKYLRFNSGYGFARYASGTGSSLKLYKK